MISLNFGNFWRFLLAGNVILKMSIWSGRHILVFRLATGIRGVFRTLPSISDGIFCENN